MARYVEGECSVVEIEESAISKLNKKINQVSANLYDSINEVAQTVETKADDERVDGIDEVIESILEDIIPSIIEGEEDEYVDMETDE